MSEVEGFSPIREIIEEAGAGGIDGYMREGEIACLLTDACRRVAEFFVELNNSGAFTERDYGRSKLLMREVRRAGCDLARQIRVLEGAKIGPSGGVDAPKG